MNVLKKPGFKTFPKYVLMFKKGSHAYFMSHFTQGIINLFFFILISKLWTMSKSYISRGFLCSLDIKWKPYIVESRHSLILQVLVVVGGVRGGCWIENIFSGQHRTRNLAPGAGTTPETWLATISRILRWLWVQSWPSQPDFNWYTHPASSIQSAVWDVPL